MEGNFMVSKDRSFLVFKYLLLMSFCVAFNLSAQSFEATVNTDRVAVGEYFQITFTLSGVDLNSVANFRAPDFSNFNIVGGPSQSQNYQYINGRSSSSLGISYYLQPRSEGSFTIGSSSIEAGGRKYSTNPVTITGVKGQSSNNRQGNNNNNSQGNSEVNMTEIAENLYIAAIPDKTTCYQGEQVTITYKIFTRLNMAAPSVSKLPTYQDFWAEDLDMPQQVQLTKEIVNGKQFTTGILKRAALFPTRSGQLSITPFELKIPVQIEKKRKQRGNFFDDFFDDPFSRQAEMVEYTARSNAISVNVLPIPENKTESFTGAVGKYTVDLSVDNKKPKKNEPITLSIKVAGSGNLKLVQLPDLNLPASFEKNDPEIKESIVRYVAIGGTKTFDYLLIPRVSGMQEIPPMTFTFFNLETKAFETIRTQGVSIDVSTQSIDPTEVSELGKKGIEKVKKELRYIKTNYSDVSDSSIYLFQKYIFAIMLFVPLALFAGIIYKTAKDNKLNSNLGLLKLTRAQKMAKKRLKIAGKFLKSKQTAEFYAEISVALFGYLEDKLNLDKADFTIEKAYDILKSKKIPESLLLDIKATLEKCDFIRFSPAGEALAEMNNMYSKVSELIVSLDSAITLAMKGKV